VGVADREQFKKRRTAQRLAPVGSCATDIEETDQQQIVTRTSNNKRDQTRSSLV